MILKKHFNKKRASTYLVLAFSSLSILLTLILSEAVGSIITERLKSTIGNSLAELALQTSDKLDRGMFERYREVKLMAKRADLLAKNVPAADKRNILDGLQQTYPDYAWLGVTDMEGKVLVSTKGLLENVNVSARPWFNNALKGVNLGDVHEAVLLAKYLDSSNSDPWRFIDLAFSYTDQNGKTAGVLGAHLSWAWAKQIQQSIIEPIKSRRNVESLIVSMSGKVLLGPADIQGKTLELASFQNAREGHNSYVIEKWPDGKSYLVGFSESRGYSSYPGLGWSVLVRQSVDDAFLPVKATQQQMVWIGVTVAAMFSIIGLLAARRISVPLFQLAQAAQRIQKGEAVTLPAPRYGFFELGILTASLNSLVENLLQKETALKELNQNLERRVDKRTQELKEALTTVQASEKRIQTIIETTPDAYIGVDLHGKISDWNSQAEKMFGWTKAEAVGQRLAKLVVPERFQPSYEYALKEFNETGNAGLITGRSERIVLNHEGTEFPVEMRVGLAGSNDTYFFSTFLHDISGRKEIARMKDEFISTVSHELRTPLTSIRASLGLLVDGMAGELPMDAKSLLDIAYTSCERLVRLISDVLDVEKIESGHMHYSIKRQPLLPLAEQAVQAIQGYASQFNVNVQLTSDGSQSMVSVDSDRIIQVLVNLLSNAIKFSPAKETVRLDIRAHAAEVRLSVADHGSGIPEEFRKRIFQKFAQADSTDSRQKGGTGLGLNICQSIVQGHGGRIDYRTEIGKGTEFYVLLPMAV